jgi:hypothetical protein
MFPGVRHVKDECCLGQKMGRVSQVKVIACKAHRFGLASLTPLSL